MEERVEFEVKENEGTTEYDVSESTEKESKSSHTGLKVIGAGAVIGLIAGLVYKHHKKKVKEAEEALSDFDDDTEEIVVEPEDQKPAKDTKSEKDPNKEKK